MRRKVYSDGSIGYQYDRGDWVQVKTRIGGGPLSLAVEIDTRGIVRQYDFRNDGPAFCDQMLIEYEGARRNDEFFLNFYAFTWDVKPCPFQEITGEHVD